MNRSGEHRFEQDTRRWDYKQTIEEAELYLGEAQKRKKRIFRDNLTSLMALTRKILKTSETVECSSLFPAIVR